MNIEIGVGIGNSSLVNLSPSDRLIAYAWASALRPNVSTSSVVHVTVNAIIANSNPSALAPALSSAGNAVITTVSANANGDAFVPSVAIAGSLSITAVVASTNANSMIPTVSTIRNVSVGGVVANSTASADVPIVSMGGGATYYLEMDGVDDKLSGSNITADEIVIDFTPRPDVWEQYFNGFNGHVNANGTNNADQIAGYTEVDVDGVVATTNTLFIKRNQRQIMRIKTASANSNYTVFFNGATDYMAGDLYDIKFYNASVLVAHIDLSTGTVLDQSGNGKDATLTGGTWVVA